MRKAEAVGGARLEHSTVPKFNACKIFYNFVLAQVVIYKKIWSSVWSDFILNFSIFYFFSFISSRNYVKLK